MVTASPQPQAAQVGPAPLRRLTSSEYLNALHDLFPNLAAQPGQTTVLTNPNTVVVYADSNAQMLNSSALSVGGVFRFYGLVFNDNGTLRMDCAQVNDGVAE